MTNENTTYRKKANAVFFAAIMVLSMVAVGFAAPAAAQAGNDSAYEDIGGNSVDVVFQGQNVYLTSADLDANLEDETVNLRSVDSYNTDSQTNDVSSSSQVEQLTVEPVGDTDFSGNAPSGYVVEIDTGDLEPNDYFLRGLGFLASNPPQDDTFEVTTQSLSTEFDDDEVTDAGANAETDLDITSDRGTYSLNVSADGDLDETELLSVFLNGNGPFAQLHLSEPVRDDITADVSGNPQFNGKSLSQALDDGDVVPELAAGLATLDEEDQIAIAEAVNNDRQAEVFETDGDNYDDPIVTNNGNVNRLGSDAQFASAFESLNSFNAFAYDSDQEDAEEKIALLGINDREETVSFDGADTDDYEFTFEGSDTEAEDTASITVSERDRSASFDEGVYTTPAGDVVEVTVDLEDTSDGWVQIGGEDSGFIDVLYVEDDDDDDEVTFQINTRTVGTVNADNVYSSEDDIVQSEIHSNGGIDADNTPAYVNEDGNALAEGNNFQGYLEALDLIDDGEAVDQQLTRPLQPTDYDIAVNGNSEFIVNDDDESELDDEIGLATLDLTEPGVENVQTWTAPNNPADDTTNTSELLETVTQRSDIAIDDQLVIQAEATGISGAMVEIDDNGFDALDDGFSASTLDTLANTNAWNGEGVNFEVESNDATGNQDPTALDLTADEDAVSVFVDQDSGQLFVVADTSSNSAFDSSVDDDTDFTAELEYEADEDNRFEFFTNNDEVNSFQGGANGVNEVAFPYFQSGEDNTQTASADFNLADRDATFDNVNEDDQVEIASSETATISGETNVAPGSDVSVRVRSAQGVSPSFVETADEFEISDDGTFEAELDLSAASIDDTATVNFRVAGNSVADSDAVIVEETQDPATFEVSDLNPQEATATAGDSVDVSATTENTGGSEGTQDVALTLDGDELDTTEVTLGAGNSTTVEFTADTSGLEAGDYEHGVATDDDDATGTLTIEAADGSSGDDSSGDDSSGDDSSGDDSSGDDSSGDDSSGDSSGDSEGDSTDDGTPGFGALVALVALIAAALLATRRND